MTANYKIIVVALLFLTLSFFSFGLPQLIDNETVYLIMSRQISDAGFIAGDWFMGAESTRAHGILFSTAIAPLWAVGLSPLQVAMTVRVLQTLFLLFGAIVLLRSLNVSLIPGLIGLSIWVIGGQLAMAGEWVLGGAEQKPFAYGFILLALSAAIQARWLLMGIFLSVATSLHILIGGWAALVLFPSALVSERSANFQKIAVSELLALALVSPTVYFALQESVHAAGSFSPVFPYTSIAELTMKLRTPHHIDPSYFIDIRSLGGHALAGACLVASLLFANFHQSAVKFLLSTVAGLLLVAGLGLVAYSIDAYAFLILYPFRVADGLLPLLAFLTTPYLLMNLSSWTNIQSRMKKVAIAGSLLATIILILGRSEIMAHKFSKTLTSWQEFQSETATSSLDDLYAWIRENTNPHATFLAPPWWDEFQIKAERPAYVMYKTVPSNDLIWEWYRRMIIANGGRSFVNNGYQIRAELKEGFTTMNENTLEDLAKNEGVDFYISPVLRDNLPYEVIYQDSNAVIYNIQRKVATSKPFHQI